MSSTAFLAPIGPETPRFGTADQKTHRLGLLDLGETLPCTRLDPFALEQTPPFLSTAAGNLCL
jgi:hypothetical protein